PFAVTSCSTAVAIHSPVSLRYTSTSNFTGPAYMISPPPCGEGSGVGSDGGFQRTRRRIGDRLIVVGGGRAADTHRPPDVAVEGDGDGAATEDERVVAERRDVAREELSALVEPLFEIERRGLEGRARVRLGAGDLRGDPECPVHAMTGDEVTGVVDDRDG